MPRTTINMDGAETAEPSACRVTRVFIVDDHALVREGIRTLLQEEADLEICGEAEGIAQARPKISELKPDLVIVDLMLGDGNGLDLIKWIAKRYPETRTIVASMHDERVYGARALRAGASGFVNKQAPSDTMCAAIRAVQKERLYFSDDLIRTLLLRARTGDTSLDRSPIDELSDRELEVFRLIGEGRTTREIASALHLSPSTVETYRGRLKQKLQLEKTSELYAEAVRFALAQTGQ